MENMVAGCCFYVAPPQDAENAPETGEGEALVLNTVLFKPAEENTVLFKPAEETAEQTQRRALFQRVCMSQSIEEIAEQIQRKALFRRVCMSHGQPCTLIIDSGSTNNLVAREMVEKLGLKRLKHPTPYRVQWLQEGHQLLVDEQCEVEFHIDEYKDKVICDIMSMNVCDILLGRPWQYDRDAVYFGKKNYYKVYKDGIKRKLVPIKDEETAGTSETRSPFLKQVESPKEKVTDIKPTTEKATEEEVPVSSPAEEVPAAAKTVDEIPATVEKSAEESTVTPPASEPQAESGPVESVQVKKPKEESAPAAKRSRAS